MPVAPGPGHDAISPARRHAYYRDSAGWGSRLWARRCGEPGA